MNSCIIPITPLEFHQICLGQKSILIRKVVPKSGDWNQQIYFYVTTDRVRYRKVPKEFHKKYEQYIGKVALTCRAEFIRTYKTTLVCDKTDWFIDTAKQTNKEILEYCGDSTEFYAIKLADIAIFLAPKKLSEFYGMCTEPYHYCPGCDHGRIVTPESEREFADDYGGVQTVWHCLNTISRAPQNFVYVFPLGESPENS